MVCAHLVRVWVAAAVEVTMERLMGTCMTGFFACFGTYCMKRSNLYLMAQPCLAALVTGPAPPS